MPSQCVSYIRVSTDDQSKNNNEQLQRDGISKLANEKDFVIVKEYADLGVSGMLKDRPALDELRVDVINGKVKDILIYAIDRLSRDKDLYGGLKYELTKEHGAKIHYVMDQATGDETIDSTMETLRALMADGERVRTLARMRAGRLAKAKAGAVYCSTSPPYGYNYIPKSKGGPAIEINEEEAEIIKIMFELFCTGTSLRQLELYLNKQGFKPRNGERWYRTTINRMLASEVYIGNFYYNKEKSSEVWVNDKDGNRKKIGKRIQRPRDEWILVEVDRIVSDELYYRAQKLLKENKKFNKRNTKRIYPYAYLIKCGVCGRNFNATHTVNQQGKEYKKYKCSSKNSSNKFYDPCSNKDYSELLLNKLVWGYLFSSKVDQNWLIDMITKIDDTDLEDVKKETDRKIAVNKKVLEKLDREEGRLLQAFKKGIFDVPKVETELSNVLKQRKEAEQEIESTRTKYRELQKAHFTKLVESDWADKIKDLNEYISNKKVPPPAELKVLLRKYINEITAYPDKIVIDGEIRIPLKDGSGSGNLDLSSGQNYRGYLIEDDILAIPYMVTIPREVYV